MSVRRNSLAVFGKSWKRKKQTQTGSDGESAGGERMQCPQCQTENKAGRKFCSACGQAFPVACSQCGFANDANDRFCGGCGAPAPLIEVMKKWLNDPMRQSCPSL